MYLSGDALQVYTLYTVYILSLFRLAYISVCHCLATTLLWVVVSRYTPYLIIFGTPLTVASTYCSFGLHRLLTLFRAPYPLVCKVALTVLTWSNSVPRTLDWFYLLSDVMKRFLASTPNTRLRWIQKFPCFLLLGLIHFLWCLWCKWIWIVMKDCWR